MAPPNGYNTIQRRPKQPTTTVKKPDIEETTSYDLLEPERLTIRPEKLINSDFRVYQARQRPDNTFEFRQFHPTAIGVEQTNQVVAHATGSTMANDEPNIVIDATSSGNTDITGMTFTGTTLLLEPSARAISGNGGTSISAPVSRAILRRNSGTRVIFRPESVAIAGAGGTAHAQAELILDYVE